MAKVRIEADRKVLYLHTEKADAETLAVRLARGHLERFKVTEHVSGLGWYVEDKETGRVFDAQGLVQ